jgi:hypothetical protein
MATAPVRPQPSPPTPTPESDSFVGEFLRWAGSALSGFVLVLLFLALGVVGLVLALVGHIGSIGWMLGLGGGLVCLGLGAVVGLMPTSDLVEGAMTWTERPFWWLMLLMPLVGLVVVAVGFVTLGAPLSAWAVMPVLPVGAALLAWRRLSRPPRGGSGEGVG